MPGMHLPKFEKIGALSHHCGVCEKPLTNSSAINTCIGTHEVICTNYHYTFHFVGKAHQCKACNHAEALLQKRHRAIADLFHQYKTLYPSSSPITSAKNGGAITPPLQLDPANESTPGKKLKRKEKKDLKRIEKAANRAPIVTQADITELGRIMYPQGLGGEGNIDSELSQALAIKFQPSIFSEVGLMEKLMIPPGSPPDFVKEADRILGELGMQKPRTGEKEEVKLWEGIKEGLKDDLENNWNASFEMKRRRVIYAQWVSQGAVDAMAQWAEGWDLGTGWKIEGEIKGIAAGKEDPDEPEEYTGAGAEESSEGEDADVDDAATVTSSLSALSIRKNTLDFSVDTLSPQITQNAPTQIIKDARRGGTPLVERMVQYPIDPDDYRIPDFETTPFKSAFVGNNATPSNSASAPPKILRIVNDVTPTRGIPSSRMMMKENVSPTIPMSKAWNAIAANNTQKRKAEAVLLSPPPPRAVKITTPMEVDDSWTPVGKGRKAKGK